MSLYGSIRMAANSLQANQIALQVVGQNIANANTPGYIREEVVLAPAPSQRYGGVMLGLGVEVEAVVQRIDSFLEERLRGSLSDRCDAETQESNYMQLEGIIGELSDTDLSTAMSNFFNSISEVLNQPENISIRNLAVLQGYTLSTDINRLADRVADMRADCNGRVINMAGDINRLVEEIRTLNVQIALVEGGQVSQSDAVGLRDKRLAAMESLAELVDVQVREQASGGVAIYSGGDFLVFEAIAREVEVELQSDRGLAAAAIHMAGTGAELQATSGQLNGLITSRDEILGGFLDSLDDFAATLAFEFNKLYSRGQGLAGFQQLSSEFAVDDADAALNNAGLEFTPQNGSFQVMVYNQKTATTRTTDVIVDLNGLGDDMSLAGLAGALNAVDGISATVTSDGKLTITSDSADEQFAFAGDTSNILAALGLNTFFSGYDAQSLGINEVVRGDPATFAASLGGIAADTQNAVELAAMLDRPIPSQNGASLAVLYDRLTSETTQSSAIAQSAAEGLRIFEQTLRGQKMATSGVNLDEEAVRMLAYQRAYQASARYIAALDELLGIIVSL